MEQKQEYAVKYGELISKCWEDEALKDRLLQAPEVVLAEFGFPVEDDVTYKVIEAPKNVRYIVLSEQPKAELQARARSLLGAADKTETILPNGQELRVIQQAKDTRYIILPASPQALSSADVNRVAGGGYHDAQAELEVQAAAVEEVVVGTTTIAGAEITAGVVAVVAVGVAVI